MVYNKVFALEPKFHGLKILQNIYFSLIWNYDSLYLLYNTASNGSSLSLFHLGTLQPLGFKNNYIFLFYWIAPN